MRLNSKPEYQAWKSMKRRCLCPQVKNYANYGGRGITICDRWIKSSAAFLADMGPRPGPDYSLERVKNHLGYSPENCVWATRPAQQRNKRPQPGPTGVQGVQLSKRGFRVRIKVNGKRIELGIYQSLEVGAAVRKVAEKLLWGNAA